MLPFDRRPWAPQLAKAVILFTLVAEVAIVFWIRHHGRLDTPEVVALVLVLIGVIPANIHIIRRKPGDQLDDYTAPPRRSLRDAIAARRTPRST